MQLTQFRCSLSPAEARKILWKGKGAGSDGRRKKYLRLSWKKKKHGERQKLDARWTKTRNARFHGYPVASYRRRSKCLWRIYVLSVPKSYTQFFNRSRSISWIDVSFSCHLTVSPIHHRYVTVYENVIAENNVNVSMEWIITQIHNVIESGKCLDNKERQQNTDKWKVRTKDDDVR